MTRKEESQVLIPPLAPTEGDGGGVALDGGAAAAVEDPERHHAAVDVIDFVASDLEESLPGVAGVEARLNRRGLLRGGRFALELRSALQTKPQAGFRATMVQWCMGATYQIVTFVLWSGGM